MMDSERCEGCQRPLYQLGLAVVRVGSEDVARRWHAWCWLTVGCPSAPGRESGMG